MSNSSINGNNNNGNNNNSNNNSNSYNDNKNNDVNNNNNNDSNSNGNNNSDDNKKCKDDNNNNNNDSNSYNNNNSNNNIIYNNTNKILMNNTIPSYIKKKERGKEKDTMKENEKLCEKTFLAPILEENENLSLFQDFLLPNKCEILSRYITPNFIHSIVNEINHDDDRFTSPRVSILLALYKNCNKKNFRIILSNAVLECTYERLERCNEATCISYKTEFDTNLIGSRGLLGLSMVSSTRETNTIYNSSSNNRNNGNNDNKMNNNNVNNNINNNMNNNINNNIHINSFKAIANGCDLINSKIKIREGLPIVHNDHDISLIEIILFITSSVCNELLSFVHKYNDICIHSNCSNNINNLNNSNKINNINENTNYLNKLSPTNTTNKKFIKNISPARTVVSTDMIVALEGLIENQKICFIIQKSLFNVLKCYANQLG